MKKKILYLLFVLVMTLSFTACGGDEAADDTEVTLRLYIAEDIEVNKTVYPVIVSGTESGKFYH